MLACIWDEHVYFSCMVINDGLWNPFFWFQRNKTGLQISIHILSGVDSSMKGSFWLLSEQRHSWNFCFLITRPHWWSMNWRTFDRTSIRLWYIHRSVFVSWFHSLRECLLKITFRMVFFVQVLDCSDRFSNFVGFTAVSSKHAFWKSVKFLSEVLLSRHTISDRCILLHFRNKCWRGIHRSSVFLS